MKKSILVAACILCALAILLGGALIWFAGTPEYALLKVMDDVKTAGMEGLRPHLTEDAQAVLDKVTTITESQLVSNIISLMGDRDKAGVLKTKMQEIQWSLVDILKSKSRAIVILGFNYQDKLVGTIELRVILQDDQWKIDGVGFPKFDEFDW